MKIAVDFDGTIVKHAYPEIGDPVPGALEWLKKFQSAGAELILWTMRGGKELMDAVVYCNENDVIFAGVNIGPGDREWTTSPKVYAEIYIDDAAFGCPLIEDHKLARPYVDWQIVGPSVMKRLSMEELNEPVSE